MSPSYNTAQALSRAVVAATNSSLAAHVCSDWNELEGFTNAWERMLAQDSGASVFMTPEWLGSWWRAFGKNGKRELLGLVFRQCDGSVAGIVPLFREHRSFMSFPLASLRMVGSGSGDSDALDFIVAPGAAPHVAGAFLAWLAQYESWDICSLEALLPDSAGAHYLRPGVSHDWCFLAENVPHSFIDLPPTWEAYLQDLEPDFRPLLTRYPKRLQSRHRVQMLRCERHQDLRPGLESLFTLHQMRWTGRGHPGAFSSSERRDFYFRMAEAFLNRGWLEFWLLTLDDETVAAQLCVRYRDTVSLLQEGFNPKYASEKVGYALRAHVLQEMIRSGVRRYDFLGGDDAYKVKFGARQGSYVDFHFAGRGLLGRSYLAHRRQSRQIKHWLKETLPKPVVAALHRRAG